VPRTLAPIGSWPSFERATTAPAPKWPSSARARLADVRRQTAAAPPKWLPATTSPPTTTTATAAAATTTNTATPTPRQRARDWSQEAAVSFRQNGRAPQAQRLHPCRRSGRVQVSCGFRRSFVCWWRAYRPGEISTRLNHGTKTRAGLTAVASPSRLPAERGRARHLVPVVVLHAAALNDQTRGHPPSDPDERHSRQVKQPRVICRAARSVAVPLGGPRSFASWLAACHMDK
jgi:hypothetical protein